MSEKALDSEQRAALDQEVKRLKRIASEWASQMHDLVEERLPAAYREIPALAQSTHDACQAWADASARLAAAQKGQAA